MPFLKSLIPKIVDSGFLSDFSQTAASSAFNRTVIAMTFGRPLFALPFGISRNPVSRSTARQVSESSAPFLNPVSRSAIRIGRRRARSSTHCARIRASSSGEGMRSRDSSFIFEISVSGPLLNGDLASHSWRTVYSRTWRRNSISRLIVAGFLGSSLVLCLTFSRAARNSLRSP
jgi:hypothetical protein